jgi:polyisoprenoid-binding protein YceI
MIRRLRALALLTAFSAAFPAFAADYTVDKDHSNVGFTIKHMMSKVSGAFTDFEGKFSFEPKKQEASSGEFTIKAASINTNNAKRDEHLKSPDFFDVQKYPTITFKSTKVDKTGKDKFKLTGDFTMHGVTKPVTFSVEYLGTAKDPWGNEKFAATAHGKINRKDFGLNWNKVLEAGGLLVGEDVDMVLQIEALQVVPGKKAQ